MRLTISAILITSSLAGCHRSVESAVDAPSVATEYLPLDLPDSTGPRVFAHYMPNFPVSIDNEPPESDYYRTEYLDPTGEDGIHMSYGGYLRDRPLPRKPSKQGKWAEQNVELEISQAESVGIDGFAVDVILPRSRSDVVDGILAAAGTPGRFSIMLTMDMGGPVATDQPMSSFIDDIVHYAKMPAAYRLSDGRLVLSAFRAELRPVGWWRQVLEGLSARGVSAVFFPILLDTSANLEKFAAISYGIGSWGGRSPNAYSLDDTRRGAWPDLARRSRALGLKIMSPVAFQDNRPYAQLYFEAMNGLTMRSGWAAAEEIKPEIVQIMTWNDYAETSAVAPSLRHGYRVLDMLAYHIAKFKSGSSPAIRRDVVFATYRTQRYQAAPSFSQPKLMQLSADSMPARNEIEVTAYGVEPSSITVRMGSEVRHCTVSKGLDYCTFPLGTGGVTIEMTRDGRTVATAGGGPAVTTSPYVQDLQYVAVGGLR
ncbi:endo-1,3-alpha-glucanase family glycosylhydrolase [Gordonia jinghuaiqii]|uniref:Glycosyl hydrolase family 71 n=1 Tax=Gordonia jinghuaiqii TaxID=2758710 RepID=A0A7D7LUJ2_9ACTN|nr:endo-1,3-alpha-glucanase family glycosylhydrolase [Gordonia jinghuaiqii]QMT01881.1 hypothetical protein H1R19_01355 [Gordonia jinghuaiqii]